VVLHTPEAALLQALDGCLGDRSVQVEPDMMFWMTRQME
jgi:hypothetical protein